MDRQALLLVFVLLFFMYSPFIMEETETEMCRHQNRTEKQVYSLFEDEIVCQVIPNRKKRKK